MTVLDRTVVPITSVKDYELLRSRAISGAGAGTHVGMVLLRRGGVAAWMSRAPTAGERTAIASDRRAGHSDAVGSDIQAGMVRVLANMALGGLGGTHT